MADEGRLELNYSLSCTEDNFFREEELKWGPDLLDRAHKRQKRPRHTLQATKNQGPILGRAGSEASTGEKPSRINCLSISD